MFTYCTRLNFIASQILPAIVIAVYKKIFIAKEKMRMENPNKTIAHAEIVIDDCVLMVSEENPQYNSRPKTLCRCWNQSKLSVVKKFSR
jgi:uncharacterized glyoxalase superfamily protein PhnB